MLNKLVAFDFCLDFISRDRRLAVFELFNQVVRALGVADVHNLTASGCVPVAFPYDFRVMVWGDRSGVVEVIIVDN